MDNPAGLLNTVSGIDSGNVVPLNPLYGTLVRMLAGTALLLAYGVARGQIGVTLSKLRDKRALGQTTAGAVFGPFLGVSLSLAAVAWTNTAVAATIMAISPVLVIPIVWLVYKQKISWRAVAGALIAFVGVAVLTFRLQILEWL
jgi:drug/metabolite transporter (DMT)-like permease